MTTYVEKATKKLFFYNCIQHIWFRASMLSCVSPARRIGQRWGATRAPRRGNAQVLEMLPALLEWGRSEMGSKLMNHSDRLTLAVTPSTLP
jgi:hypothetical protein